MFGAGKNEHILLLTIYLAIGVTLVLPSALFSLLLMPDSIIPILKYSLLILFIVNVAVSINWQRMPLLHPYIAILGAFFYFFLLRIVGDVFGILDFSQYTVLTDCIFTRDLQFKQLFTLYLALFGFQLGSIIYTTIDPIRDHYPAQNSSWLRVGLATFYIGLIIANFDLISVPEDHWFFVFITSQRGALLLRFVSHLAVAGMYFYIAGCSRSYFFFLHIIIFLSASYFGLLYIEVPLEVAFVTLFLIFFVVRRVKDRRWYAIPFILFLVAYTIWQSPTFLNSEERVNMPIRAFLIEHSDHYESLACTIEHTDVLPAGWDYLSDHSKRQRDMIVNDLAVFNLASARVPHASTSLTTYINESLLLEDRSVGRPYQSTFISEAYMWGGGLAVVLFSMLFGFILQFLSNKGLRSRIGILAVLYLLPVFISLLGNGWIAYLSYPPKHVVSLLTVVFVLWVVRLISRKYEIHL